MSKRRGNGEGSVYRRSNGRYVGEYTDDKGKRRYVSGSSRADVRAKLRDALASNGEPAPCMPTSLTVSEFLGQDHSLHYRALERLDLTFYLQIVINM